MQTAPLCDSFAAMMLSKSFGYALRGILYISLPQNRQRRVQVEEIASRLSVPRHFLGKIMKQMAAAGIIKSVKGPYGGFEINEQTLHTTILAIAVITEGEQMFNSCVLQFRQCSSKNPCPLHKKFEQVRNTFTSHLAGSTIGGLLNADVPDFIKSLAGTK